MPESAQIAMAAQTDAMAAAVMAGEYREGGIRSAVARHLLDFWTWRSLVVERGLPVPAAAGAAVAMLLAVEP